MFFPHNSRSDQLVLSSQLIPILSTVLKANSKAFQVYSLYLQSLLSRASQFTRGTDLLPDARTQYSLIGCLCPCPAWLQPPLLLGHPARPPVEKRIAPRGGSDNCTHLFSYIQRQTTFSGKVRLRSFKLSAPSTISPYFSAITSRTFSQIYFLSTLALSEWIFM